MSGARVVDKDTNRHTHRIAYYCPAWASGPGWRKSQIPISTKNVMFLYRHVYICDIDLNLLKKYKQIEVENMHFQLPPSCQAKGQEVVSPDVVVASVVAVVGAVPEQIAA